MQQLCGNLHAIKLTTAVTEAGSTARESHRSVCSWKVHTVNAGMRTLQCRCTQQACHVRSFFQGKSLSNDSLQFACAQPSGNFLHHASIWLDKAQMVFRTQPQRAQCKSAGMQTMNKAVAYSKVAVNLGVNVYSIC
jgi:hypothetical protein